MVYVVSGEARGKTRAGYSIHRKEPKVRSRLDSPEYIEHLPDYGSLVGVGPHGPGTHHTLGISRWSARGGRAVVGAVGMRPTLRMHHTHKRSMTCWRSLVTDGAENWLLSPSIVSWCDLIGRHPQN